MLMSCLGVNGFNQIGPSSPTSADELNLTRVMAGLMRTDPITGTGSNPGVAGAIQVYLAAKGIGTADYSLTSLSSPTMNTLASLNQGQTVVDTRLRVLRLVWRHVYPDRRPCSRPVVPGSQCSRPTFREYAGR